MTSEADSFIRWQSVVREQLGGTTNLVLGLATGLLALQSSILLDNKLTTPCSKGLAIAATLILSMSVGLAIWCAINRLTDFRVTAQIARRRELGETELADLRSASDALGKATWQLFRAQLLTFGVGAAASIASILVQAYV